jgi:hypothetical protein
MIEAWMDEDDGEVFFCVGGLIDLHIRSGTVSKNVKKIMDLNTNNMTEAHKMFQEHLLEQGAQLQDGTLQEGWD